MLILNALNRYRKLRGNRNGFFVGEDGVGPEPSAVYLMVELGMEWSL